MNLSHLSPALKALIAAAMISVVPLACAEDSAAPPANSQVPQRPPMPDIQAQKDAMERIGFMLGKWEGNGSMLQGSNKMLFRQTENVRLHLDGLVMLVDGRGYSPDSDNDAPMFSAFAVISYNDMSMEYEFRSYTRGYSYTSKGEFIDNDVFQWTLGPVRYKTWLSDEGKWIEIGEREMGPGNWVQFFQMELSPGV